MKRLTTTSYAILGLLSIQPASAYQLTAEMRRSAIRDFWPRTESRLYQEPKNLVAHGLIAAHTEHTGRRPRTVYEITTKGRRALRSWLSELGAPQRTEDETMLRVALAESASQAQLLATLDNEFQHLSQRAHMLASVGAELSGGEGRFPQRLHIAAALGRFAATTLRARVEYLEWLRAWVETWDDTQLDPARLAEVEDIIGDTADEIAELSAHLQHKIAVSGLGQDER